LPNGYTAEYDELLALVTPATFDFVAGQYTLAIKCMEFDTFDFVDGPQRTEVEHVEFDLDLFVTHVY